MDWQTSALIEPAKPRKPFQIVRPQIAECAEKRVCTFVADRFCDLGNSELVRRSVLSRQRLNDTCIVAVNIASSRRSARGDPAGGGAFQSRQAWAQALGSSCRIGSLGSRPHPKRIVNSDDSGGLE